MDYSLVEFINTEVNVLIKINIPDDVWEQVRDKSFALVAGLRQTIAFNDGPWDDTWKVKKVRCNNCGECCLDVGENWTFPADDEGKCSKLIKEGDKWVCDAKYDTPIRCVPDPLKANAPLCCVEYEIQPFENR